MEYCVIVILCVFVMVIIAREIYCRLLLAEFINRNEPKILAKRKSKTYSKRENGAELATVEGIHRIENKASERVEIKSFDNLKLFGHIIEAKEPVRIIIAVHGWRSSWKREFGLISDFLEREKCTVVYTEQRSHWESEGKFITFGKYERCDIVSWLDFVREKYPHLPVYLYGVSMGATSVMTAIPSAGDKVSGIIADCGFTSADDIWRNVIAEQNKMVYDSRKINRLFRNKTKLSSDCPSTVECLKQSHIPILFIHGSDDNFVPVRMTEENYEACISPKKKVIINGGKHAKNYYASPEVYENELVEFFEKYDK